MVFKALIVVVLHQSVHCVLKNASHLYFVFGATAGKDKNQGPGHNSKLLIYKQKHWEIFKSHEDYELSLKNGNQSDAYHKVQTKRTIFNHCNIFYRIFETF